jgi:hypothetical protein
VGLEAVLVDHDTMTVAALDPEDERTIEVEVAGVAALIVAKAHKIHDRLATGRADRLSDKDAADVVRIMQTASTGEVGATLAGLRRDPIAGATTETALGYMAELFGRRAGDGVAMAQRALRLAIPADQVATLCVAFTEGCWRSLASDCPRVVLVVLVLLVVRVPVGRRLPKPNNASSSTAAPTATCGRSPEERHDQAKHHRRRQRQRRRHPAHRRGLEARRPTSAHHDLREHTKRARTWPLTCY